MTLADVLGRGLDTVMDRTVVPGFTRIGPAVRKRLPGWPADPAAGSMADRTVAVTGATSGLGLATAEGLARLGARLLLVVRDVPKGQQVLAGLRAKVPGVDATVVRCDVADLDDVRRFVTELDSELGDAQVDVLVHNAGALPAERTESPQGHEQTMAVHVLGPVLMTELLHERLSGHDGRVVLVTSGGMYGQRLRADDPEYLAGEYSGTTAYARSKRAQVELLPVLARRWGSRSLGVHATHPGWAATPGVAESLPRFDRIMGPLLRDAEGGADTTVWISATQPQPRSGQLWHDRRARPTHLLPRTRTDEQERMRMWRWVSDTLELSARG